MRTMDGRVPDGTGLSQAEPCGLDPAGFDPSRDLSQRDKVWRGRIENLRSHLSLIAIGSEGNIASQARAGVREADMYLSGGWCPICEGSGIVFRTENFTDCARCEGEGYLYARDSDGSGEAGETGTDSTEGDSAGRQASPKAGRP
jgi:hypothetical protein